MTINHIAPQQPPFTRSPGRPTLYSEEVVDRLLERVCQTNESLRQICSMPGYPSRHTILKWTQQYPEFAALLHSAMVGRCHDLLMEGVEIADDSASDWTSTEDEQGVITVGANKDHISRVSLALNYRLNLAKQLSPKTAPQGMPGGPIQAPPGVDGAVLLDTRVMEGHQLRTSYEQYESALAERR